MNRLLPLLLLLCFGGLPQAAGARADVPAIEQAKKDIRQQLNDQQWSRAAGSYEQLAKRYDQQYGYNRHTVDAYTNALKYYRLAGDSTNYYNVHITLGSYYTQDLFMQSHAGQYLRKAQTYFERVGNKAKMIECRLALANMAEKLAPIPPSLITELRTIEQLSVQYGQPYFQTYAQNLLADIYLRLKRPDSAHYYASESLRHAKALKVNWLIALNYFYLGIVEQFNNQHARAIDFYQKSFRIAGAEKNIATLRELSRHSAESYAHLNDYVNAYRAMQQTLEYTNQFYYSQQTKSIRLQELNSQIETLAGAKQRAEEASRNQELLNYTLLAVLIVSVLGVVGLVFLRRQQKLIAHQQSVIAQQQIRQLELKSLRSMIEGQEGERSRIARDLHDGLGIQLSRIKLFVEAHQDELPAGVKEPLNQFLDEACTETRLISNNLRPYALSSFGLIPALDDLVQKLNLVNETRLTLEHYGDPPPLGDEPSVMVYRVVQELLNNALKHARAQAITVQIMANDETLLISVDDDGRGGDFPDEPSRGNGIANIRSRIDYLGGQVMWQSEPDRGTSVMISLPLTRLTKPVTTG